MFGASNYNYKSSYRCTTCQLDWPPVFECDTCPKCHKDTEEKPWMPMSESTYKAKLAQIAKAVAADEEKRVAEYRAKEADFEQFYEAARGPEWDAQAAAHAATLDDEWSSADWVARPPDHQRPAPPIPPTWPYFTDGRGTA